MELRHNRTMFRTLQKRTAFSFKKKRRNKERTVQKMVYSPFYFLWGSHGAGTSLDTLVAGCTTSDLPHTPPSVSLSLALFTCRTLDLSHCYFY